MLLILLSKSYALAELKKSCDPETTNKKLANLVGKSETNISEWLSLNDLPQTIRDHARKNNVILFRQLKQLAVKKASDSEKAYFALCNESDEEPSSSSEKLYKKFKSVSTHLSSTTSALKFLDKKLDTKVLQEEDKQTLIKSLDAIIKQGWWSVW